MRVLCFTLLFLAACAPALPSVTDSDRAWAQQAFPETQDDLDASRGLYAQKCSGCHMLVIPTRIPQAEWPQVVEKMAPKAKLEGIDSARILRYVLTASRPGQPPPSP